MVKKAIIAVVLVWVVVAAVGCNTVAGFGRDITNAARATEGAITK